MLYDLVSMAAEHGPTGRPLSSACRNETFEKAVTDVLERTGDSRGPVLDLARAVRRGRYQRAEALLARLNGWQREVLQGPVTALSGEDPPMSKTSGEAARPGGTPDTDLRKRQADLIRDWSVASAIPWLREQADFSMAVANPGLYSRWNNGTPSLSAALATYRLFSRATMKTSVFGSMCVLIPEGQAESRERPPQWPTWLAAELNRLTAFNQDWRPGPAARNLLPDPVRCFVDGEPRTIDQPGIGSSEAAPAWLPPQPALPSAASTAEWLHAAAQWQALLPADFAALCGQLAELAKSCSRRDALGTARSLRAAGNEAHRLRLVPDDVKITLHHALSRPVPPGLRYAPAPLPHVDPLSGPLTGSARVHAIFERAAALVHGTVSAVPLLDFLERLWRDPVVRAAARDERAVPAGNCALQPQRPATFGIYWMPKEDGGRVVNAVDRDPLCAIYRWWDLIDPGAAAKMSSALDLDLDAVTVVTHGADWSPGQAISGDVHAVPWQAACQDLNVARQDGRLVFLDRLGRPTVLIYAGLVPAVRQLGVFRLLTVLMNPWYCEHPLWNAAGQMPQVSGDRGAGPAVTDGIVTWRRERHLLAQAGLPDPGSPLEAVAAWRLAARLPDNAFFRWLSADGHTRSKPLFIPMALPIIMAAELRRRPNWAAFLQCEAAEPVPGTVGPVEEMFTVFTMPEAGR